MNHHTVSVIKIPSHPRVCPPVLGLRRSDLQCDGAGPVSRHRSDAAPVPCYISSKRTPHPNGWFSQNRCLPNLLFCYTILAFFKNSNQCTETLFPSDYHHQFQCFVITPETATADFSSSTRAASFLVSSREDPDPPATAKSWGSGISPHRAINQTYTAHRRIVVALWSVQRPIDSSPFKIRD